MIRVYCDFDGTVCPEDIGEQFFRTFVGDDAQTIVDALLRGEINAQEWLRRECQAIPSVDRTAFDAFVDAHAVDPQFPGFVQFAEERGMAVTVVSDGLDAYVARVLRAAGLERIPFFANAAHFVCRDGRDRLEVTFPYTDAECDRCGNCKRNHMLTQSADDDILVYIGDGYSDRCPVRFADVVFARRGLITYCQEQNITYHPFRGFGEVRTRLQALVERGSIRPRREAVMARREVFAQG